MSDDQIKQFFSRYVSILNSHDFRKLGEFIHDSVLVNGQAMSRSDMVEVLETHIDAVPDLVWRAQDLAIEHNQVAARFLNQGTPVKEWLGAKPNGATVAFAEHVFHKVRDGRFCELNFLLDVESIQLQLSAGARDSRSRDE